ncbi:DEKNAAC102744 [Brettanomyces naardenensis]|uniref:DEKNAAC102744 n=1 Tax=Brettanomyces naardenensis TaxID=13370 RepID=A0A448YL54_BRENA|nr:DEKNAAC102744 [Brettanomyces naardenensis]
MATTHKDGYYFTSVTELNYSRLLHHYLAFCYHYIENRILYNDGGSVYTVWNVIKPFHSKLYNSDLDSPNNNEFNNFYYYEMLAKMITFFSKNVRYRPLVKDLISTLPIDAVKVSPGLMTAMIYHCSRTGDDKLADLLMEQYTDDTLGLPMKYSSGQLCALLSLSLKNQHFDRAKEIIGFARDNLLDFNSAEFNELVIATLNSHFENADQSAWSMILDKGPGEAQFAYISYINYMIDHYDHLDFGKVQYIFKNATAAISYKNRNFWDYWQLSYFKYLNRRYPVDKAITVYANCLLDASTNTRQSHESCSHLPFKTLADLEYSTNPFTSRYDKVRMVLSDEVKPLILRDIYQTAYRTFKGSDKRLKEVATWCYKRFSDLGITDSATQIDLTKTVRQRARKLGFDLGDNNNENKKSMEEKYIENLTQFDRDWSDAYRH